MMFFTCRKIWISVRIVRKSRYGTGFLLQNTQEKSIEHARPTCMTGSGSHQFFEAHGNIIRHFKINTNVYI